MEENFEKLVASLDPDNFKHNLMSCSLYIANFEAFKSHVIEEVRSFYSPGFTEDGEIVSPNYRTNVLNKDKNTLNATLLWFKDQGAIDDSDINAFHKVRKYRNRLAHEMMELLFHGVDDGFSKNFADLMSLRIKIEKWWVFNIEIPTNPDFDNTPEVTQEDIITSSEILFKLITDMLSEDKETANYYRNELIRRKQGESY